VPKELLEEAEKAARRALEGDDEEEEDKGQGEQMEE
jgi:20S proteasome subunit alpha 7